MAHLNELVNGLVNEYYNIGFINEPLDDVMAGRPISVSWMKHGYKPWERWFADPFILEVTEDRIYVLVEEMAVWQQKGRISKLTVDRRTKELLDIQPILELPTHLSFPVIVRDGSTVYIHPENHHSGSHSLYRIDKESGKAVFVKTLIERPLSDAVTTSLFGELLMFATETPDANGNKLLVFKETENGYKQLDSITFDEKTGRMAGDFFSYGGKVYRPAQECNHSYGHCVVLQEFSRKADGWQVTELRRLYSDNPRMREGLHTFNSYQGVIVVDCVGHVLPKALRLPLTLCRDLISKFLHR